MRAYAWLLHAWLHASVRLLCACKGATATLPNAWLHAFVIGLIVCEYCIVYSCFHALLIVLSRSVYIRPSVQRVFSYSLHWKISSNSPCHSIIIKRGLAILIPITLTASAWNGNASEGFSLYNSGFTRKTGKFPTIFVKSLQTFLRKVQILRYSDS